MGQTEFQTECEEALRNAVDLAGQQVLDRRYDERLEAIVLSLSTRYGEALQVFIYTEECGYEDDTFERDDHPSDTEMIDVFVRRTLRLIEQEYKGQYLEWDR